MSPTDSSFLIMSFISLPCMLMRIGTSPPTSFSPPTTGISLEEVNFRQRHHAARLSICSPTEVISSSKASNHNPRSLRSVLPSLYQRQLPSSFGSDQIFSPSFLNL